MTVKAVAMVAATAFLLGGIDHRAHADSTTTCRVNAWGELDCTTTSAAPAGKSAIGSVVALTVLAGLLASFPGDHEVQLGIMVGVEMLPNPLVLYFDGPAPEPAAKEQWQKKTTVVAELWGSAVRDANMEAAPAPGGRLTVGRGRIGLDVAGESATDPTRYSLLAAHFLLRAPPRRRAVIALAIGASRIAFGGQVRTGLDVSVPHSYILSHDDETGAADVLIVSRPGFFYGGNGIDVRFDAALVVPVASRLAVEIGGGVFSFDKQISFKGSAGLAVAL